MILGVITARGGSKGIPKKNMVDLKGRPLLDYTLETAVACQALDRIVLSTDMPDAIKWTQLRYKRVEVPFLRPSRLCGSAVTQDAVVLHAVNFVEKQAGDSVDTIVLLQPTCPFRKAEEVDSAIRLFQKNRLKSLIGVCSAWHHPADYIYRKNKGDRKNFEFVFRKRSWKQRQDFPPVLFMTGALYICRVDYLRRNRRFYDRHSHVFQMSQETMFDIDTPFDLKLARRFLNASDHNS